MPLLKHAKKKLRQDKVRTEANRSVKNLFRDLVKKAKASGTSEAISAAFQSVDKAAKKHLIHPNKAARIKSSLSKVSAETAGSKATKTLRQSKAKKTAVKAAAQASRKTVVHKNAGAPTKVRSTKKKK